MMKRLTQLSFVFMLLMTLLPNLASAENKAKPRRMYCVTMHNPDFDYRYGITVFNTDIPASMQLLYEYNGGYAVYAAAAANDTYYAYFYEYGSRGPEPVAFSSVNLRTGEVKEIADWRDKNPSKWPKFQDMTYDYVTNQMYAITFDFGTSYLTTIDLTNGELKEVVAIERTVGPIAASNEGVFYVIDTKGNLCTLNKENGKLTTIMATDWPPSLNQSMEFDRTDGTLYWATGEFGIEESYLIKFDLAGKTYENLGILGGTGTQVLGMYIPFLKAGDDAPAAATSITAIPDANGEKKVTLTWKNPVKTFGNDNLLEITRLTISRNNEIIKTFDRVEDLVLGKEMTYEDTPTENGECVYAVTATNTAGTGEEAKIDCYVGKDTPETVKNLQAKVNTPCTSVLLTWEAPVKGAHNGYFDASNVTYKITRFPDQSIIAENLNELTYTDENTGRLTGFTYRVSATNDAGDGKAAISEKIVIGKALSLPYSYDFIDSDEFNNTWMVYDESGDGNTFVIGSPIGKPYFGDKQLMPAAEWMMQNESAPVDEWLITPPMELKAGVKNVLAFGARNVGEDQLVVTMGSTNTLDSHTTALKTFRIKSERLDLDDPKTIPFTTFAVDLGEISGTYCFGFHLNTPSGNSVIFQIGNVYAGEPTAISEEQISGIHIFNTENTLHITGEFSKAEIYNAAGVSVGTINENQSQISTTDWASGIYFVKVMSGETAKVFKTILK